MSTSTSTSPTGEHAEDTSASQLPSIRIGVPRRSRSPSGPGCTHSSKAPGAKIPALGCRLQARADQATAPTSCSARSAAEPMLKYLASGWCTTIAAVLCSGTS